jgi:predicted dehydrogenase
VRTLASSTDLPVLATATATALLALGTVALAWLARGERRRQSSLDALTTLERVRPDRRKIREFIDARDPDTNIDWKHIPKQVREAYDNVARAFDTVGVLDHIGLVRTNFVSRFYANSLYGLWNDCHLGEYVYWQQSNRDALHFSDLVEFEKRLEKGVTRHPFITGAYNKSRRQMLASRLRRKFVSRRSVFDSMVIIGAGDVVKKKLLPALQQVRGTLAGVTIADHRRISNLDFDVQKLPSLPDAAIVAWIDENPCPAIIATPTDFHLEYMRALARRQIPFAVEKPICGNRRELHCLVKEQLLKEGFAISMYVQDKGLPLTYLYTDGTEYLPFLEVLIDQRPSVGSSDDGNLRAFMSDLGKLDRVKINIFEDKSYSPSGPQRWWERPAELSAFVDLCIHPLHMATLIVGAGSRMTPIETVVGYFGPRADQLSRREGGTVQIAPTFLSCTFEVARSDCKPVPVSIAASKFAPSTWMQRRAKVDHENGRVICDFDQRVVGLIRDDPPGRIYLRVQTDLHPYQVPMQLCQNFFRTVGSHKQRPPDCSESQITALEWWYALCDFAPHGPGKRVLGADYKKVGPAVDPDDLRHLASSFRASGWRRTS